MASQLIINGVVVDGVLSLEYIHIYDHGILTIESEFSIKDMFPDIFNVFFSNKNKNKWLVRCMVIKETYTKYGESSESFYEHYETQIRGE